MAPFWEDFGRPGGVWAPLGRSWRVLGASWGRLGASWGVLAPLGRVLGPSWGRLGLQNTPKINLTRHGTGSAVLFKGSFMQKPCGTTLDRKVSSRSRTLRSLRSLRSLPRCARPAGFTGVSLGFCWGFAGDLGSPTSQTLCKSSAKSFEHRAAYPQKSTPKPSRIDPKT